MNDHRIVPGIVTATALNANANSVVANFPTTAEDDDWVVDSDNLISFPLVVRGADHQQRQIGLMRFNWRMHLTSDMYDYWIETILDNKPSNLVTAQTYDQRRKLWRVITATCNDGEISAERLRPVSGRYFMDALFSFTAGELSQA